MLQGVISSPFRGQMPAGASSGGQAWTPGGWEPISLLNSSGLVISYGQLCYLIADDAVGLAVSNLTEAQAICSCICIDPTIADAASGRFVMGGCVPDLAGGVANTLAYLSTVEGAMQSTPNLTVGEYNTMVGLWLSTTTLLFNPQFPIRN